MSSINGVYKVDKHLYLSNVKTIYNYELMKNIILNMRLIVHIIILFLFSYD